MSTSKCFLKECFRDLLIRPLFPCVEVLHVKTHGSEEYLLTSFIPPLSPHMGTQNGLCHSPFNRFKMAPTISFPRTQHFLLHLHSELRAAQFCGWTKGNKAVKLVLRRVFSKKYFPSVFQDLGNNSTIASQCWQGPICRAL